MTREELKNYLIENNTSYGAIAISTLPKHKYHHIYNLIKEYTNEFPELTIKDKIYCIINDIIEWPNCGCGCGNPVNNIDRAYLPKHGNRSEEVKQKKKESYLKKYGVENPSQAIQIKEKKKETFREHYGSDHYMQSDIGKNDYKQKLMEHYGVENNFKREDVKEYLKSEGYAIAE